MSIRVVESRLVLQEDFVGNRTFDTYEHLMVAFVQDVRGGA